MKLLTDYINESNKDLSVFIDKIKSKFKTDCTSYLPWEPGRCMVGFTEFNKEDETLKTLMSDFDVFISEISEEDITLVYFESKYGKDVTKDVYKYDKLYHLTKEKFVNDIKKNGLEPRESSGGYKKKAYHPERIYCLTQEIDKKSIKTYQGQLLSSTLVVIDLKKLKDEYKTELKFYKDPQSMESFSVYTDKSIIPNVLTFTTVDEEFK